MFALIFKQIIPYGTCGYDVINVAVTWFKNAVFSKIFSFFYSLIQKISGLTRIFSSLSKVTAMKSSCVLPNF